jgi:short-subunit dehydrogenase involved in D-alanine esterification of teichoic acids
MFRSDLLSGKRVLITGGGTGLGKGVARRFLELGATVVICGRRKEVLAETAGQLAKATGGRIHSFSCDVREAMAVEEMV